MFKVTLHEVKEKNKPELDDEFAKDVSEFDTLDELKTDLRNHMLDSRQKALDDTYETALFDQVVAGLTCDIPQAMIEQQLETLLSNFNYRLASQGMNMDTYLAMTGGNLDEVKKDYFPIAEKQVKCSLAFDAIAKAENIEVSDEELEAEFAKMAEQYQMEVQQIKNAISANHVRRDLLSAKAADVIKENAVDGDPVQPVTIDISEGSESPAQTEEKAVGEVKKSRAPRKKKAEAASEETGEEKTEA